MAVLLNSAGGSAGDPTLHGLAVEFVFASSSMDVALINDAFLDQAAGFPGTNSIKASLSPASTVVTAGNTGTYTQSTGRYAISSTTGLSAGDYIYLDHADLAVGVYKIATIVDGTKFTLVNNPLSADKSGISYQVAWRYTATLGTAPTASGSGGQINYFKVDAEDSSANAVETSDTFYIRTAPAGSAYIAIATKTYEGTATTNTIANAFDLVGAWTNEGGVSHIALTNHTGQGVNNFTWGDNTTTEKTISAAQSSGLKVTAGDGAKYGRMLLRSASGSASAVGVDIAITLDTTGPVITLYVFGR